MQKLLNQNGYTLDVDGIFGTKTQSAVKEYQQKNGLDVDGIVGNNTWAALMGTNSTSSDSVSNNDGFKYDDFKYNDYKESDIVTQAQAALNAQLANKPGAYQSQWQAQLDDTINKILNREKFSYDLNGDALYQQYKDKYIQQGQLAMGDAIGQASAMTGGYGNSYAQSVGQQAYQAQLDNLNDIVPELYQMAYDKYNQEGQDLYNQYAMLGDRENLDYGRYRDSMADWLAERDYLANRYDSERDFDYSKYNNERDFAYGQYADDKNLAYNEYRNAIEDAFKKEQFEYQKERDKVSDSQWQKEFNLAASKVNTSGGSSSSGSSSNGSSSNGSSSDASTSGDGSTDGDLQDPKCENCGGDLTDGECEACKPTVKTCELCRDEYTGEQCEFCDGELPSGGDTANPLDGKKIIFIGNSYTYYGQTVHNGSSSNLTQAKRTGDKAFFYQLCKNNGANVTVTNWTFDGHNLRYLFSDSCGATNKSCVGVDHKSYLTDRYFDYVVLQPGKNDILDGTSAQDVAAVEEMLNFFKSANPNVKFVLSVPYHCYGSIGSDLLLAKTFLNRLKTYESQGMIISDWGKVVEDILNKDVQVPNSTLSYTKNTFVISKSAKDGYHPNMLSGYITTLMTYCAITGERARGQTYAFCNDVSLNTSSINYYFNIANFITKFYTYPSNVTTNFDKVFASENDMLGIQKIIDAYLKTKPYMNYNY